MRGGLDLSDLELSPKANVYEHCNEPSSFMRGNECQLFKKVPAPQSLLQKNLTKQDSNYSKLWVVKLDIYDSEKNR